MNENTFVAKINTYHEKAYNLETQIHSANSQLKSLREAQNSLKNNKKKPPHKIEIEHKELELKIKELQLQEKSAVSELVALSLDFIINFNPEQWKNNRKYKKLFAYFTAIEADSIFDSKDETKCRTAFQKYQAAYALLSDVIKTESFTTSYKELRNAILDKMQADIQKLLLAGKYPLAVELCPDEKTRKILSGAFQRKTKFYDDTYSNFLNLSPILPTTFSDSLFTDDFIGKSARSAFVDMILFASRFTENKKAGVVLTLLSLPVSLIVAPFSALAQASQSFFSAANRNPLGISEQTEIPFYLREFASLLNNNGRNTMQGIINNIVTQYDKAHGFGVSLAFCSGDSLELSATLRSTNLSLEAKWAAIDAYMLERMNSEADRSLKHNGKKMFLIIRDELKKLYLNNTRPLLPPTYEKAIGHKQ